MQGAGGQPPGKPLSLSSIDIVRAQPKKPGIGFGKDAVGSGGGCDRVNGGTPGSQRLKARLNAIVKQSPSLFDQVYR